jgi:hypothetical protein
VTTYATCAGLARGYFRVSRGIKGNTPRADLRGGGFSLKEPRQSNKHPPLPHKKVCWPPTGARPARRPSPSGSYSTLTRTQPHRDRRSCTASGGAAGRSWEGECNSGSFLGGTLSAGATDREKQMIFNPENLAPLP